MEQINLELVGGNWPNEAWNSFDDADHRELRGRSPCSVAVATTFLEMDYAAEMLSTLVGKKGTVWEDYFHYKTDYDFGYAEYFFSVRQPQRLSKATSPRFTASLPRERNCAPTPRATFSRFRPDMGAASA